MATGGDFSRTLQAGHETYYDFSCTLCDEEGKHIEALCYCEDCFVYMCGACVKSHNRIPVNRQHKFVDQGQFKTVSQPVVKSFPTRRCSKHPGEVVNIYCKKHDVVGCCVCVAIEHSNCTQCIQHLHYAAKGIQASNEYHDIIRETQVFLSDIQRLLVDRKTDLSRIAKEKKQVKETIEDFRKKINKYFDYLEQKSLNELDLKESAIVSKLEHDKKLLEKMKREARGFLKQLNSFRGDNECELFFQVKTWKSHVHESQNRVKDISSTAKESVLFEVNGSIESYISSLDSLGSFDNQDATTAVPSSVYSSACRNLKQSSLKQACNDSGHNNKYKIKLFGKFNLKETSDKQVSSIHDICKLPDGRILITDYNNEKLKRLDEAYKLLDFVSLPGKPECVCDAGPGKAVVSMCQEHRVQFVSVGKLLTLTKSIKTKGQCRGMVYSEDKLYVCCGSLWKSSFGIIAVYSNSGKLLHSLPSTSQSLSTVPKGITVSEDGHHFFITSFYTNKISMLDLAGNIMNTFSLVDLERPKGLCTDDKGWVFVCGIDSNTVVQLSPEQSKMEVILTKTNGISNPVGICYDRTMSNLLVSCAASDELLVYTCR